MSRRTFGRLTAGLGMVGASGVVAGCGKPPSTPSSLPASPSPRSGAGVGLVLSHEQFPTPELLDQAQAAEQAGFRYLWASDHLQPWQDNQGHSMFPWLTLALVGQRTSRIEFGTGVTCPIYRYHPAAVAQAFASLAMLAPGRVFLGLGTGERLNEQAATNGFGSYVERHDRLIEAIELIRQLWSGQRISFQGRYFQTNQLKLYDLPSSPPPIFVAAGGPKSARLAGQYGDGWISQAAAVKDANLVTAFQQGAQASGRDPSDTGQADGNVRCRGRSERNQRRRGTVAIHRRCGGPTQPGRHPARRRDQPDREGHRQLDHRHRPRDPYLCSPSRSRHRSDPLHAFRPAQPRRRHRLLPRAGVSRCCTDALPPGNRLCDVDDLRSP